MKHRILLIEADRILARNVSSYLNGRGYRVDWQVNPQSAIQSADTNPPDLIILDLLLAGRNGVEFLYEFRSYPDWQEVPVIIFSSVPESEIDSVSFEHLDIKAFHYKLTAALNDLALSVDRVLQPLIV